jgi:hypothetical protein
MGGVRIRRPNLSNLAGEDAREIIDDAELIRWWCRRSGRAGGSRVFEEEEGSEVGAGVFVALSDLLAFTRLTAAWDSCFGELLVENLTTREDTHCRIQIAQVRQHLR